MTYPVPRKFRDPVYLDTEEWEVQQALREAGYSYAKTHPEGEYWWVPTKILYQAYRKYIGTKPLRKFNDPSPVDLTPQQFGVALNTLWPAIRRVRRKYHGEWMRGYNRILGPLAIRSPLYEFRRQEPRGRDPHSYQKYQRRYMRWVRQKKRAEKAVQAALEAGKLIPQPCKVCGHKSAHPRTPDVYTPSQVEWLCSGHYKEPERSYKWDKK